MTSFDEAALGGYATQIDKNIANVLAHGKYILARRLLNSKSAYAVYWSQILY